MYDFPIFQTFQNYQIREGMGGEAYIYIFICIQLFIYLYCIEDACTNDAQGLWMAEAIVDELVLLVATFVSETSADGMSSAT